MKIGLFLDDNRFIEGVLLDVKQDHLIVEVDQNIFYFALEHIHALSKNAKDFRISSTIVPHLDRNNLAELLCELKYNWVTINSLSNQAFFGVLSNISEDHIILINNHEQLYIQKSFISNIYKGIFEIIEQAEDNEEIASLNAEPKEQTHSTQEVKPIQTTANSEPGNYIETTIDEFTQEEILFNDVPEIYVEEKSVDPFNSSQDESEVTKFNNELSEIDSNAEPIADAVIQESTSYTKSSFVEPFDTSPEDREVEKLNNELPEINSSAEPRIDALIQESSSYIESSFVEPSDASSEDKEFEKLNNEPPEINSNAELSIDAVIQESSSYTESSFVEPFDIPLEATNTFISKAVRKEPSILTEEITPHSSDRNNSFSESFDTTPIKKRNFMDGQYFSAQSHQSNHKRYSEEQTELQVTHTSHHEEKEVEKLDNELTLTSSNLGDEHITFTEPHYKYKKRRNANHLNRTSRHHQEIAREFPTYEKPPVDIENNSNRQEKINQENKEEIASTNEKSTPLVTTLPQAPSMYMNTYEEKEMLVKQYYALMLHAEKMYYRLKGE